MNTVDRLKNFLQVLGYPEKLVDNSTKENVFSYRIDIQDPEMADFPANPLNLDYVYTPTKESIFEVHADYWNQNSVNAFVAITDNSSHIINAREKPDEKNPLGRTISIKSFDYGINSDGFEKEKLLEISKDAVDSAYFFDFIIKNQKTTHEVDKDLLLNLIALRNDLHRDGLEAHAYLLILKCLFLKYLEDRGIYESGYLLKVLRSGMPDILINAFNEIRKINGDIFKRDDDEEIVISPVYMEKLSIFFSCDYRSRQGKLFPYRFNKIPVQLISNVYEAFLNSEEKRGKGIYYTPSFLVNFMLSHTLREKLKGNSEATVLDPACGSGAFLVESFKLIIDSLPQKPDFRKKVEIIENQLYGIDRDSNALHIAAFSLYLVLLETEDPVYIRHQIDHAHPIIPSLIGKTLIKGNALLDDTIFEDKTFDCVIANPPWGPVPTDADPENQEERKAINTKGIEGTKTEYVNVSDYERSQAFLLRTGYWSNEDTILSMVVKNSVFLNEKAEAFRRELLKTYELSYFYELSDLDKILFKKRAIGKIDGEEIEIGATEPCAVLVYRRANGNSNTINYVTPKLTGFSDKFKMIHFGQKDVSRVMQTDFLEDDLMWRVLAKGNIDDYKLIKKISLHGKKLKIICSRGFEPDKKNLSPKKKTNYRVLIRSEDFDRYNIKKNLGQFNWHQKLRRYGNEILFSGNRILLAYRPTSRDNIRLRGIVVEDEITFRDDVIGFKIDGVDNHLVYLAILNSSCIGYYLFSTSSHWQGGLKRESLRIKDVRSLPIPEVKKFDEKGLQIMNLLEKIDAKLKNGEGINELEEKINELVFELYGLLEFEKEIIREFYQINVKRKKETVKKRDIQNYIERFRRNFNFILNPDYQLNAYYSISPHMGTVACFQMVEKKDFKRDAQQKDMSILNIVKKIQLQNFLTSRILNEDKVKIYEANCFFIVKSNYFKDWTERQAGKDANEEIGLLLKNLPEDTVG